MELERCLILVSIVLSVGQNVFAKGKRFRRQDIVFPGYDYDYSFDYVPCITVRGNEGVCLPPTECHSPRIYMGTETCGYMRGNSMICCPITPQKEVCGRINKVTLFDNVPIVMTRKKRFLHSEATPQVVGGQTAQVDSWPWMAVLGWSDTRGRLLWICGAALIAPRYVLTAAHCTRPTVVRLGEYDLENNLNGDQPEDFGVEEFLAHPGYKYPSLYNDIALIRLDRNAVNFYNIHQVCLPPINLGDIEGQPVILTGFGKTSFVGDTSNTLQEVQLQVTNQVECRKNYTNVTQVKLNFPDGIIATQLCAGVPGGGKDACQGDSGGPLVFKDRRTQVYILVGIVSGGLGCGFPNYPGVYTRITDFVKWIVENTRS